jgi:GntR family transcriptional regulator
MSKLRPETRNSAYSRPKWRRVETAILQQISSGQLEKGASLPSDRELATQFGCSLQPVVRAMEELVRKGIVQRRPGAATTVLGRLALGEPPTLSFSKHARATFGDSFRTQVIELARRVPIADEARGFEVIAQRALGLRSGDDFLVISRLRFLEQQPRVLHRSYLNPALLPASFLTDHDFSRESLIEILERAGYRLLSRKTKLRAGFPSTEAATLLRLDRVPVLEADQELLGEPSAGGSAVVVEFLHAVYANWVYELENRLPQ